MKTPMSERRDSYKVVSIEKSDTERVLAFLRQFFFRDEPLNLCIGLLDDDSTCAELEEFCTESIPEGLSLMAVIPDNEIVGVCLNGVITPEDNHHDEECAHPKFSKILKLLGRVSEESDVLGRFPHVKKALDIRVASVHVDYRGRGIAKALFDATRKMAKERDFQLVKVDCSSHFTALAVAKLGFECIYTLHYKDHLGENGKPVFVPEEPHTTVKTFIYHVD